MSPTQKLTLGISVVGTAVILAMGSLMAASGAMGGGSGGAVCSVKGLGGSEIPANYFPWLPEAAAKYKLGARGVSIVAAIHYVESDFGRSKLPGVAPGTENYMGAIGPGQFLKQYWPAYAVDGDKDGDKDAYSIPDAVFATARHMSMHGAPKNWHDAIFAYNHAEWYVEKVMRKADELEGPLKTVCEAAREEVMITGAGVQRVQEVAEWMESRKFHYCWGGGHGLRPGPSAGTGEFCPPGTEGLDCSGAVRWLLVLSGFKDPGGIVSGEFPSFYPAGRGEYVTIWSNAAHVFIEINGRDWGTSRSNFANGPGFAEHSTAGFVASHPPGL